MTTTEPVLTFDADITTAVPAEVLYDVLALVPTHLSWAGEQAKHKTFKLLTLEAPAEVATVGTTFSSTGENGNGVFHDRSTVTLADPGKGFAFETASHLDRKRGKGWDVQFRHRYELSESAEGTRVHYTCEVRPGNYVPYWLKPGVKQVVRFGTRGWMRDNLTNLARLAEQSTASR